TTDAVHEIREDLFSVWRVMDFGMELQPEEVLPLNRRGSRDGATALRQLRDLVAVAHPHFLDAIQTGKQWRVLNFDFSVAVLAPVAFLHLAAELMRHQLHPVANSQHRHSEFPNA